MANNQQMDLLKQGIQAWNAWRAEQTQVSVDLTGGALHGANISGANLNGVHLEGANFFKVIIDDADLKEANLRGVQFLQCPQLQSARNWQSSYRDEDLACGAAIPSS